MSLATKFSPCPSPSVTPPALPMRTATSLSGSRELSTTSLTMRNTLGQLGKISRDLQNAAMRMRTVPVHNAFQKMARLTREVGKKAGKGFYEYPQGATKHLWSGLAGLWKPASVQPGVAEVKQRLMAIQSIETVRCLEEAVLRAPIDADVGAILGWGFPAYLGGPIGQIHSRGVAAFVADCDELARRHGPRFEPPKSLRAMAAEGKTFFAR